MATAKNAMMATAKNAMMAMSATASGHVVIVAVIFTSSDLLALPAPPDKDPQVVE